MTVSPMFPLGSVLLPGELLPLHIFEPRYLQMVSECLLQPEPGFGVSLITRGREVGGGDTRSDLATLARIVRVEELADGRLALITVGAERVRVTRWLDDDPFPRGLIEPWPDEGGDPPFEALARVLSRAKRCAALATELGDGPFELPISSVADLPSDLVAASFALCSLSPLGAADRFKLLATPGSALRIALLEELLDDVEQALLFRLTVPPSDDRFDE